MKNKLIDSIQEADAIKALIVKGLAEIFDIFNEPKPERHITFSTEQVVVVLPSHDATSFDRIQRAGEFLKVDLDGIEIEAESDTQRDPQLVITFNL